MKLYYLSRANLKDTPFIHDLAFHFDKKEKAIILHDLFGPEIEDTRFVTKRLSAVLSESMVVNFSVSGDQKNLISGTSARPVLRSDIIRTAFETVSVFITNRLISETENEGADPVQLISLLRKEFDIQEVLLFPGNSRSPISVSKVSIETIEQRDKMLAVYEEEREVLELAFELSPSKIVSPATMKQQFQNS